MSISTSITVLILILACVIPIVLVSANKKKKKKIFLQSLQDFAKKSNCEINESDIWFDKIIGIDKRAHRLFFISGKDESKVQFEINLPDVKKCRIINYGRAVGTNTGSQTVIDNISLGFTFKNQDKNEMILEFYNADLYKMILNDELILAEKWLNITNEHLI